MEIALALESNYTLLSLHLDYKSVFIIRIVLSIHLIKYINLNEIGDIGAKAIGKALKMNSVLNSLFLCNSNEFNRFQCYI